MADSDVLGMISLNTGAMPADNDVDAKKYRHTPTYLVDGSWLGGEGVVARPGVRGAGGRSVGWLVG